MLSFLKNKKTRGGVVDTHSDGSVANSSSSVSGSANVPTSAFVGIKTSLLKRTASSSVRPQQTKLPLRKMNTSPSLFPPSASPRSPLLLLLPHQFGTQYASWSGRAPRADGKRVRRRARRYRSAVASVEIGCMSLWVGFGFVRIERESEAVRRRGVWALGFREDDDASCGGGCVQSEA